MEENENKMNETGEHVDPVGVPQTENGPADRGVTGAQNDGAQNPWVFRAAAQTQEVPVFAAPAPSAVGPTVASRKSKHRHGGVTAWLIILSVIVFFLFCGFVSVSNQVSDGGASDMLADVMDSCVSISVRTADGRGTGSGVVLSSDGYICTNYHVIENAEEITIYFFNGQSKQAEVIGYSEADDLALLKVDGRGYQAAKIGKSSACRFGERVYAIGTPAGLDYAWTVTQGIVSYPDREMKIYASDGSLQKKMHVIQTDTQVNPGNSGGALFNADGEVIGIVSMKLSGSASGSASGKSSYEGLGFAIQIEGAMEVLNAIKKDGNANGITSPVSSGRPVLGITGVSVEAGKYYLTVGNAIRETTADVYEQNPEQVLAPQATGIYISSVNAGSDAAEKLHIGDIITKVDGISVKDVRQDVWPIINAKSGGDSVRLEVYCSESGKTESVEIILGIQE